MNIVCFGFLFVFACEAPLAPSPVRICPQITKWSQDYQERLASEFEAMPADGAARRAIREHIQSRQRARACRG